MRGRPGLGGRWHPAGRTFITETLLLMKAGAFYNYRHSSRRDRRDRPIVVENFGFFEFFGFFGFGGGDVDLANR